MSSYPPPPPPPPGPSGYSTGYAPGSGYDRRAWKAQRRAAKVQARWMRDQYKMQRRFVTRRSVVGPLVLVGLGVVFLLEQTGRLSWAYSLAWYARWWPVVLIVAGVILLLEWMLDQQHIEDAGLPRTTHVLSAGAVFLLILLAFVGLSSRWVDTADWHGQFFGHDMAGLDRVFGEAHESDDAVSGTMPQGGMLVVHNPWGAVTVTGASDDGQVHVSVHKQVYTWRDDEAHVRARQMQPTFSTQGNNLMLDVPAVNQGQADLTIEMPRSTALSVSADHGDVRVNAVSGAVTVSARKGDVDLDGINGAVLAQVNNDDSSVTAKDVTGAFTLEGRAGNISLTNVNGSVMLQGDFFGTTQAEQVNGPLRFETSRTKFATARVDGELDIESGNLQGDRLLGPVTVTTRDRTIDLDDVSGPVTVTNRNGAVSVTSAAPLGPVNITNQHGSVDLGLPEHAGFVVDAEAKNGSLENDFGLDSRDDGDLHRLTGTVGSGGTRVRVQTTDGDVTLRKAVAAPLPPTAPAAPILSATPGQPAAPVAPKASAMRTPTRSRHTAKPAEPAGSAAPATPAPTE